MSVKSKDGDDDSADDDPFADDADDDLDAGDKEIDVKEEEPPSQGTKKQNLKSGKLGT